jgi:hypothetical protein
MFMGGNNRMTRNNALQNNDMNDDEEMNILTRANSPTSFNNIIDSSNAINEEQKNILKQEYSNKQIGQVKRAGTLDGQNNRPPKSKYVNNPDLAVHYLTAYNAALAGRAKAAETGVPEPRTRAERAARAVRVEDVQAGVDPIARAGEATRAPRTQPSNILNFGGPIPQGGGAMNFGGSPAMGNAPRVLFQEPLNIMPSPGWYRP